MSKRFPAILARLRVLLLGAAYSAGVLWFWLGAHEAFEGPKLQAVLIYGAALLACSAPLLWQRLPAAWTRHRGALAAGGILLVTTAASLLGGLQALPGNQGLFYEHSLPLALAALTALVFLLEDPGVQDKVLFFHLTAHVILLFYGAIQVLDQTWGAVDLIHWVRFGDVRVYSTLGNPDYMAAHLTLLAALWLGLGWRRLRVQAAVQVAALTLLLVPLAVVPLCYGAGALGPFLRGMGPWLALCVAAFVAGRLVSPRALWIGLLALLAALVLLAQGRGAWLAALTATTVMAAAAWRLAGPGFFRARWALLRWPLGAALVVGLGLIALLGARQARPQAAWTTRGVAGKVLGTVDSLASRGVHIFDKADNAQVVRRFYWQAAWNLGMAHPLLGIGYGNHALLTARAQSDVWKRWDAAGDPRATMVEPHVELYTHNDYLQNFAETGLLGLSAFLYFWAWLTVGAWRLARQGAQGGRRRRLELGLGLLGLGVAFLTNALTNFPWRVLATQQLSWLALALLSLELAKLKPVTMAASLGVPAAPVGPASPRPRNGLPSWAWGLVAVACFWGGLVGTRWYFATLLFKQGNDRKDDPAHQVEGIPYYEAAVRAGLSPTMKVELYLYLGSLYNQAGRPDLAERWFRRGIALYPDFLEAWYNLGYTYQRKFEASHDPKDRQTAMDCYQHVLDLDPRSANAGNNLGNLLYQAGDLKGAGTLYATLLRYDPSAPEARYNLAAVDVRLGDLKAAKAQLDQLLARQPTFAPAVALRKQLGR